jgi:hypothetical protein
VGYQSKTFQDANTFLDKRFMFVEKRIPTKFAVPMVHHNKSEGVIVVQHAEADSYIMAIAEGGNKARQYKFARFFSDEFAFQEHQDETATALRPTLDAGGRWLIVSSANGRQNRQFQIGYDVLVGGV